LPPPAPQAGGLARAITDAALSPGKRLRPLAALAAAEIVKTSPEAAMAVAVAVEYVHAASLVLDDLPSMDNARRRRGRPALHLVHGVATAELAAVALLARAFEVAAGAPGMTAAARGRVVEELAAAVGASGCCAGQAADLAADPATVRLDDLEAIHAQKTGALFVAAVRCGAIGGGVGEAVLTALTLYARNLGLAFQITDDLLDLEGDPAAMGKDAGRDGHRANFATVLGAPSAHRLVDELLEAAVEALGGFGRRGVVLADLSRVVRDRRS
jgi:geranylgeranyl pyrophosphate synthase